jgi:hypothetical protein
MGATPIRASILFLLGRVAELVYAADLKSAGLNNLVGSSPTSPTTKNESAKAQAHFYYSPVPLGVAEWYNQPERYYQIMEPHTQQPNSEPQTVPTPQVFVPPTVDQSISTFRKVERATAWVLILSAVLFAIIGIASIWGAFGDDSGIVWRSLGSLSVIALAALVINVGARMAEGKK